VLLRNHKPGTTSQQLQTTNHKPLHLPRILSIDYGAKRTGLAVTDPLQIIATGLTTIETPKLIPF
jgi:hypothetical protein